MVAIERDVLQFNSNYIIMGPVLFTFLLSFFTKEMAVVWTPSHRIINSLGLKVIDSEEVDLRSFSREENDKRNWNNKFVITKIKGQEGGLIIVRTERGC